MTPERGLPTPTRAEDVPTHPVQTWRGQHGGSRAPMAVTLRAYDVYCRLFGEQSALIVGNCRGGFGAGELIALLYARTFPEAEWHDRFDEALRGMESL